MRKKTIAAILIIAIGVGIICFNKEIFNVIKNAPWLSGSFEEDCTSKDYNGEKETEVSDDMIFDEIRARKAGEVLQVSGLDVQFIAGLFFKEDIGSEIEARVTGISYKENENIALSDLNYLRVLHTGFDGNVHIGELIVNKAIADDILNIMKVLYENEYPIEKMLLIDEYNGDDIASMKDNNSSAFNYRFIANTETLSNHARGMAIDINPLYNPYITWDNEGKMKVSPENGLKYVDRTLDFMWKIDEKDLCYKLFISHGFQWGGEWSITKDYQHFEKKLY